MDSPPMIYLVDEIIVSQLTPDFPGQLTITMPVILTLTYYQYRKTDTLM